MKIRRPPHVSTGLLAYRALSYACTVDWPSPAPSSHTSALHTMALHISDQFVSPTLALSLSFVGEFELPPTKPTDSRRTAAFFLRCAPLKAVGSRTRKQAEQRRVAMRGAAPRKRRR